MPDELAVEVLETDLATYLADGRCQAQAKDAVEEGAVAAVEEEDEEGGEGGEGVRG